MLAFLENYDAILSPVCAHAALPHGTSIDEGTFQGFSYTMTYNLTGWPAAVVRCGQTASGLPIGVQIAAHPWREDVALRIAGRLEELFGGWQPVASDHPARSRYTDGFSGNRVASPFAFSGREGVRT